ncbi:MAG: AbrB/MazE/SpoVT family DNA-binding domain-containing protein [Nitrospirota bacterium]|jgi:AbrB family looped-hinge helix DNA binding protein
MKTLTVSPKRQIAIPKDVCERLHIKEGDQLILEVREGKLVLEPSINIPRSQAWFWTEEVQEKIKNADKNFKVGKYRKYDVDEFVKELDKRD